MRLIGELEEQEKLSRYILRSQESGGQSPSQKGIYFDILSQKAVFIKTASFQEFFNHQIFYKISKKSSVVIPQPLSFTQVDSHPAIVMEYFPRTINLIHVNVAIKVKVYLQVLVFLHNLNPLVFPKKLPAYLQLLSLPYVFLKNIIHYPGHTFLFFRATTGILRQGFGWIFLKSNHVCHGDINVTNILVQKDKVVLLDFARCFISHKYYNLSQVLNSTWFHAGFHEKLNQAIIKIFSLNEHERKILSTFVIYNLLQRLGARYSNPSQEKFYLQRLEQVLDSI